MDIRSYKTFYTLIKVLSPKSASASTSGLYYKHTMIINYTFSIINKLEALLTDDARVIIYDRHMFIVLDIGLKPKPSSLSF